MTRRRMTIRQRWARHRRIWHDGHWTVWNDMVLSGILSLFLGLPLILPPARELWLTWRI